MARYSDELINNLKKDVSIARLVEGSGVQLKKHGKNMIGHCPFHNDKTPSLVVTPETNLWNCLGACNTGGSTIDWVMKSQSLSFRHAVEILRGDIPSLAAAEEAPTTRRRSKILPNLLSIDTEAQQLLNQVIGFYHDNLVQNPEALAYLEQRGLDDRELIECFKLGYANRTLSYRLPEKTKKAGALIRGKLQEIGVLRQSGHEHMNGSIVVPIFDANHNVVEVYGRKVLGNKLRKGTPIHLYLPGSHHGVWNAEGLAGQEEVILCEALLDAMTFWVNGYRNVTASYGTGGFTDDHLQAFKQHNIKRVLIAYDRDEAGNSAAEELAKKLIAEGLDCYRINFPKNMDANAYALQVQPANKSLGVVIRSAQWMGDVQGSTSVAVGRKPEATNGESPKKRFEEASAVTQETPTEVVNTVTGEISIPSLAAQEEPEIIEQTTTEAPVLPAAAVPPTPVNLVEPQVSEHEVVINFGEQKGESRCYRVRGLQKNNSYEVLKVNVLVTCGDALHIDTFDMYSAKHRQAFARVAAAELGVESSVIQRDLGQLLLQLESLQDKAIQEALKPEEPTAYIMDEDEKAEALALLRDPELSSRIINDFIKMGLVGEPTNALMGYIAVVSRKLSAPLAVIVQSTSAAGKSALMDAVLQLVPGEDKVQYSAMTGQSLFYLGEKNLKHKILGISEEEGVRQAAYALKLLQSQGELTMASTGKDPQSGKLITEEYRVEGPVMLFLTTTAIDIDEELLNRCVVLTIDESRDQTAAIQARQRQKRTLEGLLISNESDQLIQQHQNAQRLIRPLTVVNPYAEQLSFADSRTRTRRDHEKYLTLIDSITLLHQYQRQIKKIRQGDQVIEYIEVTKNDIALANQLAHEILGRSLDELPPPTRSLLGCINTFVKDRMKQEGIRQNEVRFTRREVRESAGLSDTQARVHLNRLVELEYVFSHSGRNGQRFVYELVFDGQLDQHQTQLVGLLDVRQLKKRSDTCPMSEASVVGTTDNLAGNKDHLAHSLRAANGELAETLLPVKIESTSSAARDLSERAATSAQILNTEEKKKTSSYGGLNEYDELARCSTPSIFTLKGTRAAEV